MRLLTHAHCSIILLQLASSSGCSYDTYWLAGTWYLTVHMMQEESLPSDSTTSIVTSEASDRGGSCSAGTGGSSVPTTNEGVRSLRSFAMNLELLVNAHYNHRISFQLLTSISISLSESIRISKKCIPNQRKR